MGNEGPKQKPEGMSATVTYIEEDWQTNKKESKSMNFSGKTLQEIANAVASYITKIEWGNSTKIATDTKVRLSDGREMTFNELMEFATKVEN